MFRTLRRITAVAVFAAAALGPTPTSVDARGTTQVSGSSFYESPGGPDFCPPPPAGYGDYPALVLSGDLEGCWYTNVLASKTTPSGAYLETGQEIFVGSLNGGREGTLRLTYRFEAKFAPDGTEIRGRCQHKIVAATGGFAGATGILLYKDAPPLFFYRGHITLG